MGTRATHRTVLLGEASGKAKLGRKSDSVQWLPELGGGGNGGQIVLRGYFMVIENVIKLDCGSWLPTCLSLLRLLDWIDFMVCK